MATILLYAAIYTVIACATPLRPTTDYDPNIDFSRFQTFTWIDANPLIRVSTQRPLSPMVQQQLMADTQRALTARGLRFEADSVRADLAVAFTVGSRENIRITTHPSASFRRPGHRSWPTHGWGGYWPNSTVETRQYTEGQLAIDLFDIENGRPAWHGTVSRRITRGDRNDPAPALQEAVEAIVALFPPS
jgi:hypothetical protein